jgi:hypothetical protein
LLTSEDKQTDSIDESLAILRMRKTDTQQRINSISFRIWAFISIFVLFGIGGYALSIQSEPLGYVQSIQIADRRISYAILSAILGAGGYWYVVFMLKMALQSKLRQIDRKLIQLGAESLQENIDEQFFTKLVKINFKYIDQYYMQTQEQADKSFKITLMASIAGLIMIAIGIGMMLFNRTSPAYVTTATGVISEFIASVFFYLYNKTIMKMSQYHQKLVITQNISLALKITEDMTGIEKTKSQELIIDRLTSEVNKHLTTGSY